MCDNLQTSTQWGEITRELEHLLHFCRTLAEDSPCDYLHLVAAIRQGGVQLIDISDRVQFRIELYEALCAQYRALGLLGFEEFEGEIQGRKMLFPWHLEDARLSGLFDLLCDQAVRNVEEEFEVRQRVQ